MNRPERLHFGTDETRHVGLDLVADPGLQIIEVPVAYREGSKSPWSNGQPSRLD
jgi:hypothetical protein